MSECSLRCRNGEQTFHRATALENRVDELGTWQRCRPGLFYEGEGSAPGGQANLGPRGTAQCVYQVLGKTLFAQYEFGMDTSQSGYYIGAGTWYTHLPPGVEMWPGYEHVFFGTVNFQEALAAPVWLGYAECARTNEIRFLLPFGHDNFRLWYAKTRGQDEVMGTGIPKIPNNWTLPVGLCAWLTVPIKNYHP